MVYQEVTRDSLVENTPMAIHARADNRWMKSARIAAVAMLLGMGSSVEAALVAVDFGVADIEGSHGSPDEIQSGFAPFVVTPSFPDALPDDENIGGGLTQRQSRTVDGIEIAIWGTANGPTFHDHGDVSGSHGDLVEDVVRVVQGNLQVDLVNVPEGTYAITTYHHFAALSEPAPLFDIALRTDAGEFLTAASGVATSFGFSPSSISTQSVMFAANGTDTVSIRLVGGGDYPDLINPILNGFTISVVPEPSTGAVAGLAIASGAVVRQRGRRAK